MHQMLFYVSHTILINIKKCTICKTKIADTSTRSQRKQPYYFDKIFLLHNKQLKLESDSPVCLSCYHITQSQAIIEPIKKIIEENMDIEAIIKIMNTKKSQSHEFINIILSAMTCATQTQR